MTCSDLTQIARGCDGGLRRPPARPAAHGHGWFFTGRGGNPPGALGAPGAPGAPPCIIRGPAARARESRRRIRGGGRRGLRGRGGAVCAGGGGGAATTDGAGRGGGVADTTGV